MPNSQHDLFNDDLVEEYLRQQEVERLADTEDLVEAVEGWVGNISSDFTERNLQQAFISDIFSDLLGYKRPRAAKEEEFQLFPEELSEGGDGFPDLLLGHFRQEDGKLTEDERKVVGELKGPGTDLDKVDPGRLKSPIEQAFEYAITNGLSVRWVVASNMEVIRLYHHGSIDHYEEWHIEEFLSDEGHLTETFWEFYFVMHRRYLIGGHEDSQIENLMSQNLSDRLELTEDFYDFYRSAVEDVYETIENQHPELVETSEGQLEVIQSAQTLIHRGLVICFFSDHPSQLLPDDLLEEVIERGKNLPSLGDNKIYPLIHDLFRVIDAGSTEDYPYEIYAYDGGLFEEDPILSEIILPDELFTKEYEIAGTTIEGIFGFHAYDFHKDLNEHVLGRIFEESVSDIEQVRENLAEGDSNPFSGSREDYGLFFTREGLTEFVAQNAIQDLLHDKRTKVRDELDLENGDMEMENPDKEFLEAYLQEIINIRIVDIACGSGAFLVACFNHLSREARRVHEKMISEQEGQTSLERFSQTEIEILDECLHGNDLLQEAVEISKLSVWLRSARKNTSLGMLTGNFSSQDALAGEIKFEDSDENPGFGEFDLVIGNPPWGGEISNEAEEWVSEEFSDFDVEQLDTYELLLLTGLKYLNDNGRLAFVLPHTLSNPEHEFIRTHLLENYTFERCHSLGADWFGPDIRMNTFTLQLQNSPPSEGTTFRSMTLVDEARRKAIDGELSLSQLESSYSFEIPQLRCIKTGELELFRYLEDDELVRTIEQNSIPLGALCEDHRGVELNKAGHTIQCPGCGVWLPPPVGRDPDSEKTCRECDLEFEYQDVLAEEYIVSDDPEAGDVLYIDGDSFGQRYDPLELKSIELGYDGIKYKGRYFYEGDKLFIRKTGVGISVAYSGDLVYCPQTVYIYKILSDRDEIIDWYADEREKWADPELVPEGLDTPEMHKFVQAVLNSRVFHYYIFKRFGEIDAAQAFAHVTQTKIRTFPIPIARLKTEEGQELVSEIANLVDEMLAGDEIGGGTDWEIEKRIRKLYGLTPKDMKYVNKQMGLVAYHKKMKELYPSGPPPAPERKQAVSLDVENGEQAEADD